MKKWIAAFILPFCLCYGNSPFNYDLHLTEIPGTNNQTTVCLHGFGNDYRMVGMVLQDSCLEDTFVTFNFPDHGIQSGKYDPHTLSYGSIHEILPAIYVLKQYVVDNGIAPINLYGFSAGGGAIVNILHTLTTTTYDEDLKNIGIDSNDKKAIVQALENGWIILDAPLKSMEEIIDLRGSNYEIDVVTGLYQGNNFSPIETLERLNNLSMNILLHFQVPDDIVSNRDDRLFAERLKKANSNGTTLISFGSDESGHLLPHPSLWEKYHEALEIGYHVKKEPEKMFIGLQIRTTNEDGQSMRDIAQLKDQFFSHGTIDKIPNKVNPSLFSVYSDYEGDYTQPFTYILGCEVSSLDDIPEGMTGITIPASAYAVFNGSGPFPLSVLKTWQKIWSATIKRAYSADFEAYPANFDPQNRSNFSIHIAIEE